MGGNSLHKIGQNQDKSFALFRPDTNLDKSFALLFETRYFSTANEIEVLPAPDSPKKQAKYFYQNICFIQFNQHVRMFYVCLMCTQLNQKEKYNHYLKRFGKKQGNINTLLLKMNIIFKVKKVVYKHVKCGYDANIFANFKSATTRSYL